MLFRLLLTLSLVGAWSLPALGCLYNPTRPVLDILKLDVLKLSIWDNPEYVLSAINFDKLDNTAGGGTWHDSEGRKGTYVSLKSETTRNLNNYCRGRLGDCPNNLAHFHRYIIMLDDGRTAWFKWSLSLVPTHPISNSGAVDMKIVRSDNGQWNTITIVDGDYTLTLVEDKIEGVPNSITYPTSSLRPY